MAIASTRPAESRGNLVPLELEALGLAARMPDLMVEARRISQTVAFGVHGRRRAGPGETFWQFRQLQDGDSRTLIDWRRSASSDRLFVREREWEAAHTVWLWADLSGSMLYRSAPNLSLKRDRALVLMFALADLLAGGGERVGVLGLFEPTSKRRPVERIAERLVETEAQKTRRESLPPSARLSRFSECVLIGDLLEPVEALAERINALAAGGVRGHLVQVLDPAEETLPFEGRIEFQGLEGEGAMLAERAGSLRDQYRSRLEAQRASLRAVASRVEWSFLIHRSDQPPEQALMALHARVSGATKASLMPPNDRAAL